ncbi:MAG: biotin/lipoyl-containing protein [Bacillota bacterium]
MKTYIVEVNNNEYEVKIKEKGENGEINVGQAKNLEENKESKVINESKTEVNKENTETKTETVGNDNSSVNTDDISGVDVEAPMSGKILSIRVNEGDSIDKNKVVMTLEAMKMETEIVSPANGKIAKILVSEGDKCKQGDKLAVIEAGGN